MKDREFGKRYKRLRHLVKAVDAQFQDYDDVGYFLIAEARGLDKTLDGGLEQLGDELADLIRNNELTEEQVMAFENIKYQSPHKNRPFMKEARGIEVMEPHSGFFEPITEIAGKFHANLMGAGKYRVQGPGTNRYEPVRIDRPKSTD